MTDEADKRHAEPDDAQLDETEPEVEEIDGIPAGVVVDGLEELDAIEVTEVRAIEPRRPALLPVPVQAAAVAVTGFFAGLLMIVLWQRRRARRAGRLPVRRRQRRDDPRSGVVASRSFLVDVHLLGGRD
jgi:hypothetical protein